MSDIDDIAAASIYRRLSALQTREAFFFALQKRAD
jgi:hypothetical protein